MTSLRINGASAQSRAESAQSRAERVQSRTDTQAPWTMLHTLSVKMDVYINAPQQACERIASRLELVFQLKKVSNSGLTHPGCPSFWRSCGPNFCRRPNNGKAPKKVIMP